MLYVKNLPTWERALRIGAGIGAVWGSLNFLSHPIGLIAAACAAGTVMSGLVGYCPMCALIGRKLDRPQ